MIFKNKSTKRFVVITLLALLLVPTLVLAFGRTGISPLDGAISTISGLFNIRSLQTNPAVQEGFLKFMIFIVLFAVSHHGFKKIGSDENKIFNNKTAGIVSFAFSMIGVFMMPTQWLLATGGTITAIMSSFIFLLVFWGGGYAAVMILKADDKAQDDYGWIKNLMGLLLILLLMFILDAWAIATNLTEDKLPVGISFSDLNSFVVGIYAVLVQWTTLLLAVLLIVKIVQLVQGFGLGSGGTRRTNTATDDRDSTDTPERVAARRAEREALREAENHAIDSSLSAPTIISGHRN